MTQGQQALQLVTGFKCTQCYDSGHVAATATTTSYCNCHWHLRGDQRPINQLLNALPIFEKRDREFPRAFDCARALVRATAQQPVRAYTLAQFLGLGKGWEREVKRLIKTLRDDWQLPIGSSREWPYGYYWISTPDEFESWLRTLKAQAMSELRTAYRMAKRHYPQLCGQFTFNFEEEATHNEEQA